MCSAGRLRALAVSSGKRFSAVPELPTVAESGVPGFDVSSWYGLLAPAKTPPAIVRKMNADAVKVMREPDVRQEAGGLGPRGGGIDAAAIRRRSSRRK